MQKAQCFSDIPTPYMKAITPRIVIVSDGTPKVCRERRITNHLHKNCLCKWRIFNGLK